MAQKKVYIFVYYDLVRVGHYNDDDIKEVLSENGYRTVKEMFENEGDDLIDGVYDDNSQYYLSSINGVKVLDAPLDDCRPYDLISEVFDEIEDIQDFVNIQIHSVPLQRKGLSCKQYSEYLGSCAEIIVDEKFVIEPSKITVSNDRYVIYDGKKYKYDYWAGDDDGGKEYYYNGVKLD